MCDPKPRMYEQRLRFAFRRDSWRENTPIDTYYGLSLMPLECPCRVSTAVNGGIVGGGMTVCVCRSSGIRILSAIQKRRFPQFTAGVCVPLDLKYLHKINRLLHTVTLFLPCLRVTVFAATYIGVTHKPLRNFGAVCPVLRRTKI